ncbi:hypothetical protein M2138_000371 [Dysgonomonadaceae bacterium PH5-43]|nr:hypothetical protein [Dysgonomonadaceae bacterium PH5-43]
MKRSISILIILFTIVFIQCGIAQTKVLKVNATKTNDYGVQYSLPKSVLTLNVEYTKTEYEAGTYARYASRYLGIDDNDVAIENQTVYSLDKVSIKESGVPDTDKTYLVLFKSKTTAPFVCLTEDGLICSINAEYTPEKESVKVVDNNKTTTTALKINPQSIYTEEYLQAGSISKMAEVAAKNIYKIRESRQDIITGETDNVPKDGEAMKIILGNLDAQEKLWTELFLGKTKTTKLTKQITIEPTTEVNKEVLFRFSKYLGVVSADDLSGSPVYMNIINLHSVEIQAEDPKRKSKESESIVYNVPGKAKIEIFNGTTKILDSTINLTQFGTTQILGTSVFEDKKAPVQILFYPESGAIKRIMQ